MADETQVDGWCELCRAVTDRDEAGSHAGRLRIVQSVALLVECAHYRRCRMHRFKGDDVVLVKSEGATWVGTITSIAWLKGRQVNATVLNEDFGELATVPIECLTPHEEGVRGEWGGPIPGEDLDA